MPRDISSGPSIKVSQKTIDKIKADGMTASLKKAGAGNVSTEYMEAVKRMYGATRIKAAQGKSQNAASNKLKSGTASSPYGFSGAGKPKVAKKAGGADVKKLK